MTKPLLDHLAAYRASQRKAVDFLLANMHDDGSIADATRDACYYRVPWALAVTGESAAAMRMLEWIRRNMMTAEGELAGQILPNNNWYRSVNTYTETCLAYGAQLLRQYDVAQRFVRFALRSQNAATGGAYMDRQHKGPDGPQMLFLTAYRSAQRKAVEFLLAHVNEDGSIGNAAQNTSWLRPSAVTTADSVCTPSWTA